METSADVTGSQTRQIYLAIYPAPPSSKINILRAHWVLWIPSLADPNIGKMIHVTGTPFTGYGLEFKRNATLRGTKACLPFAQVNSRYVADIVSDGKESVDVEARDELEKVAKMVQAPGVSQEPMNLAVVGGTPSLRSQMQGRC